MTAFTWVESTIQVKGGLPLPVAVLGAGLFYAWEAMGMTAAVAASRWAHRRGGSPRAAATAAGFSAAFVMVLWELHGFHVYQWGWGATLGACPGSPAPPPS